MKRILLLGATGSIGVNALHVIREFPSRYEVAGISAAKNIEVLEAQAREFRPASVHVYDEEKARAFAPVAKELGITLYVGDEGLLSIVKETEYDLLVNSLVGGVGFVPTVEAIVKGADVALANKESLVIGGEIIIPLAKARGVSIIPIDSEHSALFQIIRHFKDVAIHKVILTASGGPFFKRPKDEFASITVKDALNHPTWDMGSKITIDSATMMNKGFEVIEAHHLFNIPYDKIDVIIHPQSIIHSLVEFVDGEIYAQLGPTDMRYPIQNALTYPEVLPTPFHRLDLTSITEMNFYPPDAEKFPMLALAYEYGARGGMAPVALNAANEVAVAAFLQNEIRFIDIPAIVRNVTEGTREEDLRVDSVTRVNDDAHARARDAVAQFAT